MSFAREIEGDAYLVGSAACQRAERALNSACRLVDIGLEGGGLVLVGVCVRHDCCGCWNRLIL